MLLFEKESAMINKAVFEVHKRLGVGFLEKVYQEALAVEFTLQGIPFLREVPFKVFYKGITLNTEYIADFVCFNKIIVELKAVSEIADIHKMQVRSYLSATGMELGLLYNLNDLYVKPIRILNANEQ